jgi:hypothetical protein
VTVVSLGIDSSEIEISVANICGIRLSDRRLGKGAAIMLHANLVKGRDDLTN